MPNISSSFSNELDIYQNPELIYSDIYENQELFNEAVNEILVGALKVTYKIYEKVNTIVNSNKEKISNLLYQTGNQTNQNISRDTLCELLWSNKLKTRFLANFIVPSFKESIIQELQSHFENKLNYKFSNYKSDFVLFEFNLRPLSNLVSTVMNNSSGIGFTIVPRFLGCKDETISSDYHSTNLPQAKYVIYFDFDSVVNYFVTNAKFSNSPEDIETIESFVENNMSTFNSLVYDLSRRIIVELIDRINSINNNFDKFNSKLSIVTEEINKSDLNKSIVNKMRYLLRSTLSQTFVDDGEFNRLFNHIDNLNANDYKVNGHGWSYFSNELSALCIIPDVSDDQYNISTLITNLYNYAFSVYFSNEVLVILNYGPKVGNILDKTDNKYSYCREFDKKYDLIELLTETEKLSDYNLRDYYKELFKNFKSSSTFTPFMSKNMPNGEKEAFLNSKATRILSLYSYGIMVFFDKLYDYVKQISANKANVNPKYDSKLSTTIRETIRNKAYILKDLFMRTINPDSGYGIDTFVKEGFSKLAFLISVSKNHIATNNSLPDKDCTEGKLLELIGKDYQLDETINNSQYYKSIGDNMETLVNNIVVYPL